MLLTDTVINTAYVPLEVGSQNVNSSKLLERLLVFADHVRLVEIAAGFQDAVSKPTICPDRRLRCNLDAAHPQDLFWINGRNVFHHGKPRALPLALDADNDLCLGIVYLPKTLDLCFEVEKR